MTNLDALYRIFEKPNPKKIELTNYVIIFDGILTAIQNNHLSQILEERFYIENLFYFLQNCPSSFDTQNNDQLTSTIESTSYIIYEIFKFIVENYEKFSDIHENTSLKQLLSFKTIFNCIKIFCHSKNFEKQIQNIISKMIAIRSQTHIEISNSKKIMNLELEKILTILKDRISISKPEIIEILDFTFICQTLVVDLNKLRFFDKNFILNLSALLECLIYISEQQEPNSAFSKNFEHLNISIMQILEKWLLDIDISPEIIETYVGIVQNYKCTIFLIENGQIDTLIFQKFKTVLNPSQYELVYDRLFDSKFDRKVKKVCLVLPHVDPEDVSQLLKMYQNPENLISAFMDDPRLHQTLQHCVSKKKMEIVLDCEKVNESLDIENDPDLKEVNLKLIQRQEMESEEERLLEEVEEEEMYNDDFDESFLEEIPPKEEPEPVLRIVENKPALKEQKTEKHVRFVDNPEVVYVPKVEDINRKGNSKTNIIIKDVSKKEKPRKNNHRKKR